MSICIMYGAEPYLINYNRNKFFHDIQKEGIVFMEGIFNEAVYEECITYSFFSQKKGVVLTLDNWKELDTAPFQLYLDNPSAETKLLILIRNMDDRMKSSKLYKKLSKDNKIISCDKLTKEQDLVTFIIKIINRYGGRIRESAIAEILRRLNYFERDDVSLYNVSHMMESLVSICPEITIELVEKNLPDYSTGDVFRLARLIQDGSSSELLRQINLLKQEKRIMILSLLLREYRIAYKLCLFSKSDIGIKYNAFKNMSIEKAFRGMKIIENTIFSIKTGEIDEDTALHYACSLLIHDSDS